MSLLTGLGILAGAVAGGSDKTTREEVELGRASELERLLSSRQGIQSIFSEIQTLTEAGPGREDVEAGVESQRSLAALLGQAADTGGLPSETDIAQSRAIASNLIQGQQEALNQSFERQETQAARQAALSGRSATDPILRAKLGQSQTQQQSLLSAQQGSLAQQLALQLPSQRIQFAGARADVLSGLGQSALSNRANLLSIGSQLLAQERQFRLATATRKTTQEGSLGAAIAGGISGGISGFGAEQKIQASKQALANQREQNQILRQALNRPASSTSAPSFSTSAPQAPVTINPFPIVTPNLTPPQPTGSFPLTESGLRNFGGDLLTQSLAGEGFNN